MDKSKFLIVFTVGLFSLLAFRLVQLQLVQHDKYKHLAKNNSTRVSVRRAARGIIYDRDNNILATSKQSLSVVVYPSILKEEQDKKRAADLLSRILDSDYDDLFAVFNGMNPTAPLPLTIDHDISMQAAVKIFENQLLLPGVLVERQAIRYYPESDFAAHLLGYVGQVDERELKYRKHRLRLGDVVGKSGLESSFDELLRGLNGEERVSVDRYGRLTSLASQNKKMIKEPERGQDLTLTIDSHLQRVAESAMGSMRGALVAINPQNGEILALVSKPSFDPNIFTKPIPTRVYHHLSVGKAFLNRALLDFTPGSIWKPVSAIAAIDNNVTNGFEQLKVSGSTMLGGFRFGDWTSKEDVMDMRGALQWSRNTYFYQIAKRMDPNWIADLGEGFGVGEKTGIEIEGESSGILPSPRWKKKKLREPWFPGNTLHFSIGQSFLTMTPLQAVRIISTIATGGELPNLHLLRDAKTFKKHKVDISYNALNIVQEGLRRCVSSGTGVAARVPGVIVAGKTGSAEVPGYAKSTHGWFVAYAPAGKGERAEIAIAVLGEGAGHGGTVAAPVAQKVLAAYFKTR